MLQIKDHMLTGSNVKKPIKTNKHSGEFKPGDLDTIVLHYTGGPSQPSINTLVNPKVKASAHVVVDRDGSITQLVPFNLIAWHAGKSQYKGRVGYNKYSIGIEMVNSGVLTKSGNIYRSWFGAPYNPSDVIQAIHRNQTKPKYWHVYTSEQIEAVTELCQVLIENYGIKSILGHEEVAPKRKIDPGPAFPLDRIRNQLLGEGRDLDGGEDTPDTGRVIANSLNIRVLPKTGASLVAKPLKKGQKVVIVDEANGWYKVKTEVEGWVFGKYIEFV